MQQPAAVPDSSYFARLGLDYDPFAAGAMPDFFFVGAQRRFLVQRAVHALYFSGATVLLLADDGAGKTRTLDEIEKEFKDLADICRIEATVLMDATEIRALLANVLGLPNTVAANNTELVSALERVRPADGDPQPILIAIDAAQLLSIAALADCAALIAGAGGRLRLLLAGESDLAIAWQQTQAGAVEILKLEPLNRSETEDYVRTKLQAAGYREEQPLSDMEFDQLFAQSEGNFAAINSLVPQLFKPTADIAVPAIQRIKAIPLLHIGIAAALLAVVIIVALYRGDSQMQTQNATAMLQAADKPSQQISKANGSEQNTIALQLPAPTTTSSTPPAQTSPVSTENNVQAISTPASSPVSVPPQMESMSVENKSQAIEKQTVVESKNSATKKENMTKPEVAAHAEKSKQEIAKPEKANNKHANTNAPVFNTDEQALLALPSSNYVLQLIGAESKATIDKFSNGAGKGLKLHCYRTRLRGKPWFIAVIGPYADKDAAQAALNKLPEAVRKQQPWPRSLANVQADIRAHAGH